MSFSFSGNNGMASGKVVVSWNHRDRIIWRRFSEFLFFNEWEWDEQCGARSDESAGNVQTVFSDLRLFSAYCS